MTEKKPIDLTDNEIHEASSVFSFDVSECSKRLKRGDDWQRTVHGHLFFDHILTAMITEMLVRPTELRIDRMAFATKVELASSMGLLSVEWRGFLKAFNSLRNRIAHKLDFRVTRRHAVDLVNGSPDALKVVISDEHERFGGTLLQHCIKINLLMLDIIRQHHVAVRLHHAKQAARLRAALDNLDKRGITIERIHRALGEDDGA